MAAKLLASLLVTSGTVQSRCGVEMKDQGKKRAGPSVMELVVPSRAPKSPGNRLAIRPRRRPPLPPPSFSKNQKKTKSTDLGDGCNSLTRGLFVQASYLLPPQPQWMGGYAAGNDTQHPPKGEQTTNRLRWDGRWRISIQHDSDEETEERCSLTSIQRCGPTI